MTYKCLLVDDESLAQELLAAYIAKIPYLELVQKCSTAIEAQIALQQHDIDILFLDIEMPELTGIDFLRSLSKKPATIFTTAYANYALEAFDLDVVDYLLKPIEFSRFFKAVTKAIQRIGGENISALPTEEKTNYFFVKADYKTVKVNHEDVLFIESHQKYICIYTTKQKIITLLSLSNIMQHLPSQQFVRVHRSYIINIDKIDSIEGNMIHINKHELPISKGQKEAFFALIDKQKLF